MKVDRRSLPKRLWHPLEFAAVRCAMGLVRLLPVEAASRWMGGLWAWLGPMNRRHRRALDHLAAALPDLSADHRDKIARQSWRNLGCILAETVNIHRIARQPERIEISADTAAMLDRFKARPCIFVSLHTGNWELLGVTAGLAGFKLAGIYQSMTNPSVERLSVSLRAPYYREGLLAKGHGTARELIAILKRGGSLAFLADHRDLRGIQVPFFGRAAYSTPIPASLARNYDVPIIAARLIRTGPVRFKLDVEPVPVPVTEDRKQDIADATTAYHAVFERWIRDYPGQWMWIHRKWVGHDHREPADGQ